MLEAMLIFYDRVMQAPSIVWVIGLIMGAISGYLLQQFIDDRLFAAFSALAMFVAVLIASVAFNDVGLVFTGDRDANVVASAGAAVCSVTLIAILLLRVWNAAAEVRHRKRTLA